MKTRILLPIAIFAASCDIIIDPMYDYRDRITGTYFVQEYSETYRMSTTYQITVTEGFGNIVYLDNFYGSGLRVVGRLNGNQIDIGHQYQDGYEIQGVATINGNEMRLTYSVQNRLSRYADFCNSVAWKW